MIKKTKKKKTKTVDLEKVPRIMIGIDEAAKAYGISPAAFWALHNSGKVPQNYHYGSRALWSVAELKQFAKMGVSSRSTPRWQAYLKQQRSLK